MPQKMVQGVKIMETGHKEWQFDYQESDMESAYRRGDWHSWQELVRWLEQKGEEHKRLTPGETVAMVEDLRSLMQSGTPFTKDPNRAYQMAHKFRAENNRRFAQEHAREVSEAKAQGKK